MVLHQWQLQNHHHTLQLPPLLLRQHLNQKRSTREEKEQHQGGELRATWGPDLFGDLRVQGPQGIAFPRRAALSLCLKTQGLLNQNLLTYSLGHVTGFVHIGAVVQGRLRRISSSSCDKSDAVFYSYELNT